MAEHEGPGGGAARTVVRAFDVRTVIGGLLTAYGAVTLVMGLVATSEEDLERAGGMNVNLVTGVVLLVVGLSFLLWVRLRPLVVADPDAGPVADPGTGPGDGASTEGGAAGRG